MKKKKIFSGSAVALVTPMHEDNSINFEVINELIEFHIKNSTQAIVINATTGEGSTLSSNEREKIISFTVEKVNNRIPVIVGAGSNDTKRAVEFSLIAQENGADAVLIITPYYNKTSQVGILKHYEYISDRINLPIILYNNPSRTGLNILPQTYFELSKIQNIVATKEANLDFSSIIKTISLCKDSLYVYSGNDDITIPVLSIGGIGVISAFANICPKVSQDICRYFFDNKIYKSLELLFEYESLMNVIYKDVNPMPIKEALNIIGFYCGKCRLPLTQINHDVKSEISRLIKSKKVKI